MAILEVNQDEQLGIKKEFDEGGVELAFKALQQDIYSYPVRSFVRETISNCLDSIKERDIAQDIFAGAPVSKYYKIRESSALLKDSSFDKEYYDKKYLSKDQIISVTYTERSGRDLISIKDNGVGLGGNRLKGFFKLGYSSKRNMKDVMGKFGSGAKAGLATGIEFFTVTTIYNGYSTSFMVFENDYDPITPEDPQGKVEEWPVTFANGSKGVKNVYWAKTTELNGVTVTLEVKPHNKALFLESVREQFQYFRRRIKLTIKEHGENPVTELLDIKPLYESGNLVIPPVSTYNGPHILVDGISYGLVSWDELELEKRYGRIALKVSSSEVDITQARELLKWTEKTKKTVIRLLKTAEAEASSYVSSKLALDKTDNIFDFNNKYSVVTESSSDNVSSVFARFLSIFRVLPNYSIDLPTVEGVTRMVEFSFNQTFFKDYFYYYNVKKVSLSSKGNKVTISSTTCNSFLDIVNLPIIYSSEAALGVKRLSYLLKNKFPEADELIYIRLSTAQKTRTYTEDSCKQFLDGEAKGALSLPLSTLFEVASKTIKSYCSFNLDSHDWDEVEEELSDEVEVATNTISAARLRALNAQILYRSKEFTYGRKHRGAETRYYGTFKKSVIKIKDLKEEFDDSSDLVICTGKTSAIGDFIGTLAYIFKMNTTVIYVSKDALPLFAPYGTLVENYIRRFNPNTHELMIGKAIQKFNTQREFTTLVAQNNSILKHSSVVKALFNADAGRLDELYRGPDVTVSFEEHISSNSNIKPEILSQLFEYLKRVTEFQKVLTTGKQELIAKKSQELFGSSEVYTLDSYDEELIGEIKSELDRVKVVAPLFNDVSYPSEESVNLLNELITFKNKQNDNI